jgi:hypothetical protein
MLFRLSPLIVSSGNVATSPAVLDHVQEVFGSDQSEPKQEVSPADPSPVPSTHPVSHGAESGGTTQTLSQPLPVTVSSDNTDNPPVLDRIREPAESSTHTFDPSVASEDTSGRKSTPSTTRDLIPHGVVESSDAYSLLKSVGSCLCIILDNCEV